jgi:Zn-dependent M28 family amino/carboxypeptidase
VRSVTTSIDEFPHTGAMNYDAAVPKVPAAAVCTADAELIAALLQKGPVRLRLELGCQTLPDVESANVVGELRGDSLPDEVVVIGGHLDAWDLGLGAHDDGAGCAHVLEAMRLLQTSGLHHKRTIRAVLFMNEENGLRGGEAYAQAHAAEKHVAALETDGGGAAPEGIGCSLRDAAAAPIRAAMAPLAAHDAGTFLEGGGGGADIGPLAKQGVPMFSLIVNDARYFDYHHSAQDIPAAVNGRELALGAATVAFAALMLADQ